LKVAKLRSALALLLMTTALPACSVSVPGFGGGDSDAPKTTGSIVPPVEVVEPLPRTLAYSDAAKIGQAASAALWQSGDAAAEAPPAGEWLNAATGSSGTFSAEAEGSTVGVSNAPTPEDCRAFSTIVTSIGGVHSYSGRICRGAAGGSVLTIASPEPAAAL
jgi:hypothetical protein